MNRVIQMLMQMLFRRVMRRGFGKTTRRGGNTRTIPGTAGALGRKLGSMKRLNRWFK